MTHAQWIGICHPCSIRHSCPPCVTGTRGQSLRGDYKAVPLAIFPFPSCTRVVLQIGICSLACGEQWFKPGRRLRLLIGFILLSSVIWSKLESQTSGAEKNYWSDPFNLPWEHKGWRQEVISLAMSWGDQEPRQPSTLYPWFLGLALQISHWHVFLRLVLLPD